jgi:NADPH:quinone reductase-like Zn-dependent oxidoreductase
VSQIKPCRFGHGQNGAWVAWPPTGNPRPPAARDHLEGDEMRTSANTVLITGGATGIGLALARTLVERGNQVLVCGRRREAPIAAKSKVPELQVRACDVSKPRSKLALLA